jgi:hypothetical protein
MQGSCDGRTTGMFGEAVMAEPWDGVGTAATAGTHKAQEGLLGECDAHTGGETSVGTMSIRLSKDNHGSWGTCTTSTECKTVKIAMLTVMSGMDPHMISGNLGWVFVMSW